MADNFFAMLEDGTVRKIPLIQNVERNIQDVFAIHGAAMLAGKSEEEFDGNYRIEEDEIMYVTMDLPIELKYVAQNPIGIPILDIDKEKIRALFWYENQEYFFQNFDNRKMLRHRKVLFFNNQTFNRLSESAFVLDNVVDAIYKGGRFYFSSYAKANRIFSLLDFYQEATDDDVADFAGHNVISIGDRQWFLDNSNTVIRKHITLLNNANVLDNLDTGKVQRGAKKFKLMINLDPQGKIIFPKNGKTCRDILFFLNEQYYLGLITKRQYRTSSKKWINKS